MSPIVAIVLLLAANEAQADLNDARQSALDRAMKAVAQAATMAAADPARPRYHFLPPAQWMNDPNGPIYYKGYYHLFYQHNPYGDVWNHMHWGHARSKDLFHWEHLPIALWPSKELGENHCFSGCAILTPSGAPRIFYTSIGQRLPEQWAAVPVDDDLRVWSKHPKNPLLTEQLHGSVKIHDWRDPYVFQEADSYYMVAGGNLNEHKGGEAVVNLYQAAKGDLETWTYRGVMFKHPDKNAANIECPNFLRLGDKWVLIVSPHRSVEYFIGDFDPVAGLFTWKRRGIVDYGSYYAPNGLIDPDGRQLLWGWINGFKPGKSWNGCLTLPRALSLNAGGMLVQEPAVELQSLRRDPVDIDAKVLHDGETISTPLGKAELEFMCSFKCGAAGSLRLRLDCRTESESNFDIVATADNVLVGDTRVPIAASDKPERSLRVYLDHSVVEVFVDGGEACVTKVLEGCRDYTAMHTSAEGGDVDVSSLTVWPLQAPL